jgi:hypothetical protein
MVPNPFRRLRRNRGEGGSAESSQAPSELPSQASSPPRTPTVASPRSGPFSPGRDGEAAIDDLPAAPASPDPARPPHCSLATTRTQRGAAEGGRSGMTEASIGGAAIGGAAQPLLGSDISPSGTKTDTINTSNAEPSTPLMCRAFTPFQWLGDLLAPMLPAIEAALLSPPPVRSALSGAPRLEPTLQPQPDQDGPAGSLLMPPGVSGGGLGLPRAGLVIANLPGVPLTLQLKPPDNLEDYMDDPGA